MLCAVAPKENSKKKLSKVMKRKEKLKNCKKAKLPFADAGVGAKHVLSVVFFFLL